MHFEVSLDYSLELVFSVSLLDGAVQENTSPAACNSSQVLNEAYQCSMYHHNLYSC